ncbi:hypothetical protein Tco_1032838 [Tanacetum coccineum]|uniref:Uncharacterized protein n=1 Tax=Tanacetum coccineum TaxID=301880 RepID=A0ABQ5GFA1_9ASTR
MEESQIKLLENKATNEKMEYLLKEMKKITTSGTQEEGQSSTPIADKINVLEKQIVEGKLVLVDDDGHTKGIVDSGNRIITVYPYIITFNDVRDDYLDTILANIDVSDQPPLDISDIPPFMCSMGKSPRNKKQPSRNYKMSYDGERPSVTINRILTREELSREELEKDLWERIMIVCEKRPIIEALKYSDKRNKLLDSVLLDKFKLDGDLEIEE